MAKTECGAKTRVGGRCKAPARANGRCRMHGGTSKGPKQAKRPGNTNAVTHGFYSDALRGDELKLWNRVELGSLDDELRLARVKLHRLVRLAGDADVAELIDSAIEVAKKRDTHPELGEFEKSEIKVKVPQYGDLIVRQIDVIRKLELARLQLAEGAHAAKDREREAALQEKSTEPISEFRVTIVTPENYKPHDHGTDR